MLNVLVKQYIKKRAKQCKRCCPENIETMLLQEVQEATDASKKVIFSWIWDIGGRGLNASATIPGIIVVNAEWAARIALYPEDLNMHDAFRLTMGHEFTHQENDYFFLDPFTINEKFVYWVNEVHADFGGIIKAFGGSVEHGMSAMEYKKKSKIREDKDTYTHPSWERRIYFIKKYDFNKNLIKEIADIVGCKNEQLISSVSNHFEEIKLCRNMSTKGKTK